MNITVTIILILIALVVTLGGVVFSLIDSNNKKKEKICELQNALESAKINIRQLSEYIDEVRKIKKEEKGIAQQIKEAKNDEEVFTIISSIVHSNNERVQND